MANVKRECVSCLQRKLGLSLFTKRLSRIIDVERESGRGDECIVCSGFVATTFTFTEDQAWQT